MSGPPLPSEAAAAVELADVADPAWGRFVARHPEATCFHHPSWSSTLASAYGFAVRVAVQRGTDGTVVAGMPLAEVRRPTGARRWSCLPFSDECAPLVAPGMSAAGLLQGVDALRRAHHVADLEVRTGDAADTRAYAGAVPADLVLACGVFGNISDSDIERTLRGLPMFAAQGATVIWTRHRREPDGTVNIRRWLDDSGFENTSYDPVPDSDTLGTVGIALFRGETQPLRDEHLFTFNRKTL